MSLRPKLLGHIQWALGSGECLGVRNNLKQPTSCTALSQKMSWESQYTNLPWILCKEHNLVIIQTLLPILETGVQRVAKHFSSWGCHGGLERTLQTPAGFANAKEDGAPSSCHTALLFSIQWQSVSKLDKQSKLTKRMRTEDKQQGSFWWWSRLCSEFQLSTKGLFRIFCRVYCRPSFGTLCRY